MTWEERNLEFTRRLSAIVESGKPACYTCTFWAASRTGPDGARYLIANDRAECRRRSPSSDRFTWQGTGMAVARWPGTQPWDWCGEYVKEQKP